LSKDKLQPITTTQLPSIFLSYARVDDEDGFVKALYDELVQQNFTVWWDKVSMPSRGLTFLHEIAHAIDSPDVQRYPFRIEWVVNQAFEIFHYQPLLFVVDSFDHLYALVTELEQWMIAGKLDNVAPGEPGVSESDLASFLAGSG